MPIVAVANGLNGLCFMFRKMTNTSKLYACAPYICSKMIHDTTRRKNSNVEATSENIGESIFSIGNPHLYESLRENIKYYYYHTLNSPMLYFSPSMQIDFDRQLFF